MLEGDFSVRRLSKEVLYCFSIKVRFTNIYIYIFVEHLSVNILVTLC